MLNFARMAFILSALGVRCTPASLPENPADRAGILQTSIPLPSSSQDTRPADAVCGDPSRPGVPVRACPDGSCAPGAHPAVSQTGTSICLMN